MKVKIGDSERLNILGRSDVLPKRDNAAAALKRWQRKLNYFSIFAVIPAILALQDARAEGAKLPAAPAAGQAGRPHSSLSKNCSKPELLRRQSNYLLPHQKRKFDMVAAFAGSDSCPGFAIPPGTYTAAAPFTDTGDTTGANNTVTNACGGFYGSFSGPDLIYSFTLTARGASPQIRVTPNMSTYDPAIYILDGSRGSGCPAGVSNTATDCLVASISFANGQAEISAEEMSGLPLNVPLHLFVDSYSFYNVTPLTSGPYTLRIQDVTIAALPSNDAPVDFNADGKTDFTVIRNTGGGESGQVTWLTTLNGGNPTGEVNWGIASDQIVPADYDIDGKDDYAVFRPGPQGKFFIIQSRTGTFRVEDFGQTGDDASVVADYNGDGTDDIAVYRGGTTPGEQSFWFYKPQGAAFFSRVAWGQAGDVPAPGDYDDDGKSDFVIRRAHQNGVDAEFYKRLSGGVLSIEGFGRALDKIAPGDYDGDGKTDLAVVRPGPDGFLVWEFEPSATQGMSIVRALWGVSATDTITQGDYDGDGKTEYSVWRPGASGTFFMMAVGTGRITTATWGATGDRPAAGFNVH